MVDLAEVHDRDGEEIRQVVECDAMARMPLASVLYLLLTGGGRAKGEECAEAIPA